MDPSKQRHSVDEGVEEEEEQAFLPTQTIQNDAAWSHQQQQRQQQRRGGVTRYLRLAMEISMAVIIVLLVAFVLRERNDWEAEKKKEDDQRTPVPKFPRKPYKFLPDPHFVRDDMLFTEEDTLETLHNWLPLSADARGYVQIADYETYPLLSHPYTVAINRTSDGPAYMMSVFHQLHCLSYLVQHYQQGYGGVELTEEVAHHSSHCFDYLRQSIMCNGDTNLEGETEAGPGWGSDHMCVDYDALRDWANDHGAQRWRTGLLPGVAIL
ncbi:hypothetical protein GGS20DRAFT_255060 [Poronia punctata]|nr:hypothetical protein GGS20DRAFT_255060 [Poronia punctata]